MNDKPKISVDELKGYDVIVMVDKSGSMGTKSTKMEGKTRWQECAETAVSLARFLEPVDADGLTLITFNSSVQVYDNQTADKLDALFASEQPGGSTNLGAALEQAFAKKFGSGKPTLVFVFTDGEPDSRTAAENAIVNAANKLNADEELAVQFVQIGDDAGAAAFLQHLDDNLQGKGAKFDIVNTLKREEAEGLTVEQLCWQALND